MELKISVEELNKALYRAQGIVEKKTTMPILANVLLTASKGTLTVTAFDLDIGLTSEHPAEVSKEGAITLSAKHLFDIVRSLPEATVSLAKQSNQYVEIRSGPAHFKIVGMAAEEYPPLPKEGSAALAKVNARSLLEMIEKTSFAVSSDETRYVLNGVYFESKDGGLARMVATDGHRLSLVERSMEGAFQLKKGVIIPRKGLFELKRLLEEAPDADCQLGFTESSALFAKPGLRMVMRLIDGQFPEYQQVIPKEGEKIIKIGRVRMTDALKRISLLSADKTAHPVRVDLSDGCLKISSQNPDLGEAKEEIPVEYKGGAMQVGFNARYLSDVLAVVGTEDVSFELIDEHSPGVLKAVGDQGFTAVVMPMRI